MYCEHCGTKSDGTSKFCTNCGKPLSGEAKKEIPKEETITYTAKKPRRGPTIPSWIGIVVIVGLIIWGAYSSSKNDASIQSAQTALNIANSSDTADATLLAISQYKDALKNATDDNNKRIILTNMALIYHSSGDITDALSTYRQALGYVSSGSSDSYLISGEIAEIQGQPDVAQTDLERANQLNPNDYQINNELALFYADLDDFWTKYDDLPKALQYMKVAYGLQKNDQSAVNLSVIDYYNKDYQDTIDLLLPINLNNYPPAALYLGYAYARQKDIKNAEYYFQKAIDLGVKVPQEVYDYLNS